MARPSRKGGRITAAKARNASPTKGRKTTKTKRRIAPAATRVKRRPASSPNKDLKEAREQQAATAEILKVIASSPGDVQPVLDAVAERAMRLLGAWSVLVTRFDGDLLHFGAARGALPDTEQFLRNLFPMRPEAAVFAGRCILERSAINISDARADPSPQNRDRARLRGFRAALSVPMLQKGQPIGVISVSRREAGSFAAYEVELLQAFCDQAVIAIGNAQLFNEMQEALNRQSATAEILKVIASSPSDVRPVFEAIVESAKRLLSGFSAAVFRFIDDIAYLQAITATNPAADEIVKNSFPRPVADFQSFALAQGGSIVQVPDTEALSNDIRDIARARGFRSMLIAPLTNRGTPIGMISVTRVQVGTFSVHHEQLLQAFADQAVIAIENTRLFDEVQAKTGDLSEALRQQTATGDVLKVIASSPTDVGPALQAIVESACTFCNAYDAGVLLKTGNDLHFSAHHGPLRTGQQPRPISREWVVGRSVVDKVPVQVSDFQAPEAAEFPEGQRQSLEQGHRCTLSVPLLRDGEAIGAIALRRREPVAFTDKQVDLLQTFADQAVIAIGNVRLFDEVQARTRDLTESLQQQTATADVLKVISRSAFDLETVLDALLSSACRLCEADIGTIRYKEGDEFRLAATFGCKPEWIEHFRRYSTKPDRSSVFGRTIADGHIVHIPDLLADPDYKRPEAQKLMGFRAALGVPLAREGEAFGVINLFRFNVSSFEDRQIELVQTFADQAVIAIENVRLFNETQQSLARQAATTEILEVVNGSLGNLTPVFDAILEKATLLSSSAFGALAIHNGDDIHQIVAMRGMPVEFPDFLRGPVRLGPETGLGRLVRGESFVHIIDAADDEAYRLGNPVRRALVDIAGARSYLAVPIVKDGVLLASFTIYRREVRPFEADVIALLQNFATQAAIAIQNARLFNEVKQRTEDLSESLQQQTAAADVLKVISRSSVDLDTVLDTLVETVARLCRADQATMFRRRDDEYHLVAARGFSAEGQEFVLTHPLTINRGTLSGRVAAERRPVHITDVLQDPEYNYREGQAILGYRTMLGIPLLREQTLIGIFSIHRTRVEPFTRKEIELATSFADQAVIAIENARLFEE